MLDEKKESETAMKNFTDPNGVARKAFVSGGKIVTMGIPTIASEWLRDDQKRTAARWLNILSLFFIAGGWIAFVGVVLQNFDSSRNPIAEFFARSSWQGLWFWLTFLVLMRVMARMDEEERRHESPHSFAVKNSSLESHSDNNVIFAERSFSSDLFRVVQEQWRQAIRKFESPWQIFPWLERMLKTPEAGWMFLRLGRSPKELLQRLVQNFPKLTVQDPEKARLTFEEIFLTAYQHVGKLRGRFVSVIDVCVALVEREEEIQKILDREEITLSQLKHVQAWWHLQNRWQEQLFRLRSAAQFRPKGHMNRALTARPTPFLDHVGVDLTSRAKAGALLPLIGRETEVDMMLRVFEKGLGNILVKGESGTGKSAMISGLAEIMAAEFVPETIQDHRLVLVDVAALASVGSLSTGLTTIFSECQAAGNIVLAFDDLKDLLLEETESLLTQNLNQTSFHVIATTTNEDYRNFLQNHGALMRRFDVVEIREMEDEQAISVCEFYVQLWERKYSVFFTEQAVVLAVTLSRKVLHDRFLPASALSILEEAAVMVKNRSKFQRMVKRSDVAEILSQKSGVPVDQAEGAERDKLLNLETQLHQRVVGQDAAISEVANALRRARTSLADSARPIASFLFFGPTGVGKTEVAKAVAAAYYGSETAMIRLDMSEYAENSSLDRLIGAVGGGASQRGVLTDAVRNQPFSLILLDEFEKAHRDVVNVFLQVFEDGRLTDASGRTIDFRNTLIIATSNAGTEVFLEGLRRNIPEEKLRKIVVEETLPKIFRPELLNRFDAIIPFHPLNYDHMVEITRREITKIALRLKEKGVTLGMSEDALLEFAKEGWDVTYGARPLRRLLQDRVENVVAKALLKGELSRQDQIIIEPGGQFRLKKAKGV